MLFAGAIAACGILLLLRVPFAEGQSSEATTSEVFMMEQVLSENGCGAFAGLVAATAGAGEAFREQIATVFCPDDMAVVAFGGPGRFSNLSADDQVALLLYHGVATRWSEEALRAIDGEVATLASASGPGGYGVLTIRDYGGTVMLRSPLNQARVTKMVVDNDRLAVYLIGTVLVPGPTAAPFDWAAVLLLFVPSVGLLLLCALMIALVHLVPRLRSSYQNYVWAARVAPHG